MLFSLSVFKGSASVMIFRALQCLGAEVFQRSLFLVVMDVIGFCWPYRSPTNQFSACV